MWKLEIYQMWMFTQGNRRSQYNVVADVVQEVGSTLVSIMARDDRNKRGIGSGFIVEQNGLILGRKCQSQSTHVAFS